MPILKATAAEHAMVLGSTRLAGPSREEAEKREGEIAALAEPVVAKLGAAFPQDAEKAGYLVLNAFIAVGGEGQTPGPVYFGPWPKLMDELVKVVRASAPGYGEALCKACERLLVTDAKAQKLLPPDYQPPKA